MIASSIVCQQIVTPYALFIVRPVLTAKRTFSLIDLESEVSLTSFGPLLT